MLRSVELKDYMIHNPVKVKADDNIFEAIHEILVHKVSGVCVVDAKDRLLGVLSEMDCMQAILGVVYNQGHVGSVEEFMTSAGNVISVSPDENIVDVATDMLKHKHRRRPVIQDGRLVGQVTCRQLLRAVKEFAAPTDPSEH